jgi:hypothetical protein
MGAPNCFLNYSRKVSQLHSFIALNGSMTISELEKLHTKQLQFIVRYIPELAWRTNENNICQVREAGFRLIFEPRIPQI